MNDLPLWVAAAAGLWLAACLGTGAVITLRGRRAGFGREHGYLLAALLFFAAAAVIRLVFEIRGEAPGFFAGPLHLVIGAAFVFASWRARRRRLEPEASDSGSAGTFREKSAALVAAALIVVFARYFLATWNASLEEAIPVFIGSVILIVVIAIVGHIVVAITHSPIEEVEEPQDERSRAIDLRSIRNSHYTVTATLWIVPVVAIMSLPAIVIANVALAILVVSEVLYYGSIFAYHRWGRDG